MKKYRLHYPDCDSGDDRGWILPGRIQFKR
jgi:hypothetical protein